MSTHPDSNDPKRCNAQHPSLLVGCSRNAGHLHSHAITREQYGGPTTWSQLVDERNERNDDDSEERVK